MHDRKRGMMGMGKKMIIKRKKEDEKNMDVCLPLTLTGPDLPEGCTSYLSLLPFYLFISLFLSL